jgi:hypothetical protein
MYREASSTLLFGLVQQDIDLPNPFENKRLLKSLPEDKSGSDFYLKPEDDLKLYGAIGNAGCVNL